MFAQSDQSNSVFIDTSMALLDGVGLLGVPGLRHWLIVVKHQMEPDVLLPQLFLATIFQ